jgi:glucose-6-phosphate isomerase
LATSERVRLDLEGVFPQGCGQSAGLDTGEFERLVRVLADKVQVEGLRRRTGFMDVGRLADDWRMHVRDAMPARESYDTLLVFGIGGSSLGARAVLRALGCPAADVRVVDNVDPHTIRTALEGLTPARTIVNVVSKSGRTLETMGSFLHVLSWLENSLSDSEVRKRVIATTGPTGTLREWSSRRRWRTLPVPPEIGGRYSVFTPVGLFPLAAAGLDIDAFLDGAASIGDAERRDAARLAAALYQLDTVKKRNVHVIWPYSDRLLDLGAWFLQLWAESLGKKRDGKLGVGPTPVLARGATDQHSQLQLYMEGPPIHAFLFMHLIDSGPDVDLPGAPDLPEGLQYLAGRTAGEVLDVLRRSTARALREAGRPCITLSLPKADERSLGRAMQTLMTATALAGVAYGVDPFDQPGVEAAKRHARAILGAPQRS